MRVSNEFEWETAEGLVRRSHELVVGGPKGRAGESGKGARQRA